jgi:protein-L-isoaspartate(D-aspartate) O-methyltransferase
MITPAPDFTSARQRMVAKQITARGLRDARLLAAFESVSRHRFIPDPAERQWAYADSPCAIGFGQTISQPYMVALMTDLLHLKGDERVLEVGTGSGYQAAILSLLAAEVHTVEVIPDLAASAARLLIELGYANVHMHTGDGSLGWPDAAPYDGIIVAAAAPRVPAPLLAQLADDGALVLPVGVPRGIQQLELWEKTGGELSCRRIVEVAFVPLRGALGWQS